jgi:hypothetical protein
MRGGSAVLFLLSVLAVGFGGLVTYDQTNGPRLSAAHERQRAAETGQEDRTFCTKLGLAPGTAQFSSCGDGLADYRRQAEERFAKETGPY